MVPEKVSEPVSEKIGTGKKSRNWYQKNLAPEKVSELASKIFNRNFLLIQCKFIRLEVIGPGAGAAAGRRNHALNLEKIWANQRRADQLCRLQGKALLRRGHFKID